MPPLHTDDGPVMVGEGGVLIDTVLKQLDVQPLASVTVTFTVKVPDAPAVTVTVEVFVAPTEVPLPLTLQL